MSRYTRQIDEDDTSSESTARRVARASCTRMNARRFHDRVKVTWLSILNRRRFVYRRPTSAMCQCNRFTRAIPRGTSRRVRLLYLSQLVVRRVPRRGGSCWAFLCSPRDSESEGRKRDQCSVTDSLALEIPRKHVEQKRNILSKGRIPFRDSSRRDSWLLRA